MNPKQLAEKLRRRCLRSFGAEVATVHGVRKLTAPLGSLARGLRATSVGYGFRVEGNYAWEIDIVVLPTLDVMSEIVYGRPPPGVIACALGDVGDR